MLYMRCMRVRQLIENVLAVIGLIALLVGVFLVLHILERQAPPPPDITICSEGKCFYYNVKIPEGKP